MSNVRVPFTKDNEDTAVLLLDAAEKTDEGVAAVRTGSGFFIVDESLAKAAGVEYDTPEEDTQVEHARHVTQGQPSLDDGKGNEAEVSETIKQSETPQAEEEPKKAPAKKAAKKTTAKKTAAKKTAAKDKE